MKLTVSTKQLTETVAPLVEPITLAQAKLHLRVDGTDNDDLITAQIKAARRWVEKAIQRALVRRTYRADLWGFYDEIVLPLPPLASITSIKYFNTDSPEVLTTLDSAIYIADLSYNRIYIDPSYIGTIPDVATRHDAVQVTYVAGDAPDTSSPIDNAANVDDAIKAAIKLIVGDLFANRETNTQLRIQHLKAVDRILALYREY